MLWTKTLRLHRIHMALEIYYCPTQVKTTQSPNTYQRYITKQHFYQILIWKNIRVRLKMLWKHFDYQYSKNYNLIALSLELGTVWPKILTMLQIHSLSNAKSWAWHTYVSEHSDPTHFRVISQYANSVSGNTTEQRPGQLSCFTARRKKEA